MPEQRRPVVGILYPGEMGSTLGGLLRRQGCRVVATGEGRSPRTRRLAEAAGLEVVASLREVADAADVVLSTVPPAAARGVAEAYRACRPAPAPGRLFVDLNSISPATCAGIAAVFAGSGVDFVDGAIHGLAAQLQTRGTLYLSGARSRETAALFEPVLRAKVLGDLPGQASAFKMMISGMAKGIVALFLEMGLVARQAGLLDDVLACYRESYPGVMAVVDRMLPTYPQHAKRRGEELGEVEQTMLDLGLLPCMVSGARSLTAAVGRLDLTKPDAAGDWSAAEVVEEVFARNPLLAPAPTVV